MRILVGIEHPKRVHFMKNPVKKLVELGHEVKIVARDKDITLKLLDLMGFDYDVYGRNYHGLTKKAYGLAEGDLKLLKLAKEFNPDIFFAKGSAYIGQVSKLLNRPYICFSDTEYAKLANLVTYPFADVICTPSCFKKRLNNSNHIIYNGYEELSYLHPNHFKPDPSILDDLGVDKDDNIIVLRLVSWTASHDRGHTGITNVEEIVGLLEKYGQVFISSEIELKQSLKKYAVNVSQEKIHHLMYYADLYIGESPTMACESVLVGTPAIFVSTERRGYTDELGDKYGLLYNFSDSSTMKRSTLETALELLENKKLVKEWKRRREIMLNEKIDVTEFITNLVSDYPESLNNLENTVVSYRWMKKQNTS
ncbi:MAG: DUF354 domain-containing protein [bacterium]